MAPEYMHAGVLSFEHVARFEQAARAAGLRTRSVHLGSLSMLEAAKLVGSVLLNGSQSGPRAVQYDVTLCQSRRGCWNPSRLTSLSDFSTQMAPPKQTGSVECCRCP